VLWRVQKDLDHHGDHNLLPTFPDKGDCPIKIKNSKPDLAVSDVSMDDFKRIISKMI